MNALLKDWETASAGSRSLPSTPKRRPKLPPSDARAAMARVPPDRAYISQVNPSLIRNLDSMIQFDLQIPQSVIHQSYGVTQVNYRQINYTNPNYISQSPSHQMAYPSAMQYQALSPMYTSQPTYQPPPMVARQYPPSYNQHGSPIKTYVQSTTSPKHISYEQPAGYSPSHKLYGSPVVQPKPMFSNGELLQQQLYNHHQYQQYKEAREQVLAQHHPAPPPGAGYRAANRSYQSSVSIPIVKSQQVDMNSMHRKQYELT